MKKKYYEELEEERSRLVYENQEQLYKIWSLQKMVRGLKEALDGCDELCRKCEGKGLPRV